jgi:DNA mismatch repair protein MutL
VNNRFIKSPYLNHAVMNAYQEMIPGDSFPMYVLFIDLDPTQVDVNVHPTKQEIKFEDEKIIYAFLQAAVKHALAQFSVTPTLDFDLDASIQQLPSIQQPFTKQKEEATASTSIFKGFTQKNQAHFIEKAELKHWKDFFESPEKPEAGSQRPESESRSENLSHTSDLILQASTDFSLTQLLNTYIILPSSNGFLLIHQQAAHERIIYERLLEATKGTAVATQRSMFPLTVELSPADAALLEELMPDLQQLGYMIEPFGKNTFVIQGTPADVEQGNEKKIMESLLEQYKHFSNDMKFSKREKLVRSLTWQQAIKPGTPLSEKEMKAIVEDLFKCSTPNITPNGNPTYMEFKKDYLEKLFKG